MPNRFKSVASRTTCVPTRRITVPSPRAPLPQDLDPITPGTKSGPVSTFRVQNDIPIRQTIEQGPATGPAHLLCTGAFEATHPPATRGW